MVVFFWLGGMELATRVGHLEDVEGLAAGSASFLERVSRSFLKRSCDLFSSSIVA